MAGQGNKNRISAREATPAILEKIDIKSAQTGSKDSVSVVNGTSRVLYWESVLSDGIRASVTFTDAGNTLKTSKLTRRGRRPTAKKISAVEGLPIQGNEEVYLKFTDNLGNTLSFGKEKNNSFKVNERIDLSTGNETTDKSYMLDLATEDWLNNDEGFTKVRSCMSGLVSSHVKTILKDFLKTKKDYSDIEQTRNKEDYDGQNAKPLFCLNELSKSAVPGDAKDSGKTAGYFFWETSEGYHFKSIDTLMSQEHKIKIIYNETSALIPVGYNVKALSLETNNKVNVKRKKQAGAYFGSCKTLDIYNLKLTNNELSGEKNAESSEVKLAGEKLPTIKSSFDGEGKADSNHTRNIWQFITTGQRHFGPIDQQLSESKEINFDVKGVFTQSLMRYNQLFASEVTVVIPGDFSLHAGDAVWVDIPQTDVTENKACGDEVDKETGGKYLIVDLCHYITAKETYTKLVLIRDSFGRKGNPSKGASSSSSNIKKAMNLGSGGNFL